MGPWAAFKQFIFWCTKSLYLLVGDWGLAIIIVTLIFRLIIFPITQKQIKSSLAMNKLQPQIKEIQEKYAGDQAKISEETQKLYSEAKFNPLSGCLPLVLQMPIFIALFQVLRSLDTYIASAADLTGAAAENICFYNIIPDLTLIMKEAWAAGFAVVLPYLILVLIFSASFIIPQLLNGQKLERSMMLMMGFMTIFMLWAAIQSPGGVLLYWDVSSIFGVVQQLITRSRNKSKAALEAVEQEKVVQPVNVSVVRKEKKPRPTKKR